MQTDGGFVEHVEHAGQCAADLAGEPDPLALAPRKRREGAVEGEVVEADVDQEFQPAGRFPQQVTGDPFLVTTHLHAPQDSQCVVEWQATERPDGLAEQLYGRDVGPEPAAVAGRASDLPHQVQQPPAVGGRNT